MSESNHDDFLWDRSGPPDPDLQRLENLLAPFGHDERAFAGTRRASGPRWAVAAVAVALISAATIYSMWPEPAADEPGDEIILVRRSNGERLNRDELLDTHDTKVVLELGELGVITLDPDSRLLVRRLHKNKTRLELQRGRLHALVYLDAAPRFFEVGTPATTCIDLGCEYTLEVDPITKAVHVEVRTGRVAFRDHGREIYVPADAVCDATLARGAGTPRFVDTPAELAAKLDEFDAGEAAAHLRLATEILTTIATGTEVERDRHTLIVWHFLQDPSPEVAHAALRWLLERYENPAGAAPIPGTAVSPEDRESWKVSLEPLWW